jgi:hypothetical protein
VSVAGRHSRCQGDRHHAEVNSFSHHRGQSPVYLIR